MIAGGATVIDLAAYLGVTPGRVRQWWRRRKQAQEAAEACGWILLEDRWISSSPPPTSASEWGR